MYFVQGIIGIGLSVLCIRFRRQIYEFTGPIAFAEKYVSNTVTFYALLGIISIIISILWMFGTIQNFIAEKGAQFI